MPKGSPTPTAVSGRVSASSPSERPATATGNARGIRRRSGAPATPSSQPRVSANVRNTLSACDIMEADSSRNIGELAANNAASSPTPCPPTRDPRRYASHVAAPASSAFTSHGAPSRIPSESAAGHPGGYLPKRRPS